MSSNTCTPTSRAFSLCKVHDSYKKRINHAHFNVPKYKLKGQNVKRVRDHIFFWTLYHFFKLIQAFVFPVWSYSFKLKSLALENITSWRWMFGCWWQTVQLASLNLHLTTSLSGSCASKWMLWKQFWGILSIIKKMMKQDYLFMEMDVSVNENGNVKYMY